MGYCRQSHIEAFLMLPFFSLATLLHFSCHCVPKSRGVSQERLGLEFWSLFLDLVLVPI